MTMRTDRCPYCGEPGVIEKKLLFYPTPGHRRQYTYYAECQNPECEIQPRTEELDDFGRSRETAIQCAIYRWNQLVRDVKRAQALEWWRE